MKSLIIVVSGSSTLMLATSTTFTLALVLFWYNSMVRTCTLPDLGFLFRLLRLCLEPITARAEFGNGLVQQEFLQRPLLNVLTFVILELGNVLHRALEDAAFVLLAARYNLRELVDAFVNCFAAAAFNCALC
jgi:hypothetical protein